MPPHVPATDEQTPTTKEWAFLAGNGGSWVRMVMMARVGGRVVVRVRSAPRFATTATGPLLVEMCILHSRTTVGTALSSAKCTSRRPGASAAASARPAAPLPGARGGAVCPNLLQRLGSSRGPRGESLIFRASSRRRSRRGAPLRQIWTRPAPGMPQEPHLHRPAPAHPPHRADPGPRATAPDEKGSHSRPRRRAAPEVTAGAPFWRRPRLYPRSRRRR